MRGKLSSLVVFVAALFVSGCSGAMPECGPSTCVGCCDAQGECVIAPSAVQCGGSGNVCTQCFPGQICLGGLCTTQSTGTGGGSSMGGGGGSSMGGGGGSSVGGGGGSSMGGGGGSSMGGGGGSSVGGGGGSSVGGGGGSSVGGGGGSSMGGGGGTMTGGGGGSMTGGGGGSMDAGVPPLRVFVTSTTVTGAFGSPANADALCNTAAQAANKGGTWKAWVSTSTESAVSRMVNGGPWVQENAAGATFLTFNNKANLQTTPLAGIVYDEQGRTVSSGSYWTGTASGGSASSNCTNWSTNNANGTFGNANSTSSSWTAAGTTSCYDALRILCFEQSRMPLPAPATQQRRVFVTSTTVTGAFGALSNADALCNTAAQAANKTGTWKAWVSTSTESAISRMANVGPWVQQNAAGVNFLTFNNKANLQTTPLAGIVYDEQGRTVSSGSYWTGTASGGSAGSNCTNWSTNNANGTFGNTNSTSGSWTAAGTTSCYDALRILCFEQ